jgi:glycerol-3-phosphate dehydrogenase
MLDMVSGDTGRRKAEGIFTNKGLDKPDETLESDAKYPPGHNPVMGSESRANK